MIALGVLGCLIIPFLYYATSVYQYAQANKPEGYKYPEVKQLWMTGVGFCSYKMMEEVVYGVTRPIFTWLMPKSIDQDPKALDRKVNKACHNMNGLLFHSTATYWGWHVMKNSTWLPWYMGGLNPDGNMYGSFQVLFIDTPPGTHCYILFTYGYHLLNFVNHFFKEKNNDWRTMLIHHIAAVALFPGLIFGGLLGAGVVAAWLHDVADIFVAICRILNVLEYKWSSTFAFIAMITVWFYTRLMLLP